MATLTRTVVFTDIADYTASVGRSDREGLRNLIAAHEQAVAPVLERHNGRIVKNLGDSFMASFESATDAVRSGLDLVETVSGGGTFAMRVAMATGDVEEIDGDAFGEAVNLASRILSKCPAGEVWFSAATQLCMNPSEIPWEPVGHYALKGITGDVEIFRAIPESRCWLPEPVGHATRLGRLVRIRLGDPAPVLPQDPVILLEGFELGSDELRELVDALPVIDPACLWFVTYKIAPSDRLKWISAGHGMVIGQPKALDESIEEQAQSHSTTTGSDTIILDVGRMSVIEVALAGLALPAVPMSEVVAGYSYDLLADGRWVNRSDNAVARVEITQTKVLFTALVPGLFLYGRQLVPGQPSELMSGSEIHTPSGPIRFTAINDKGYLGYLYAETLARLGIGPGQQAEIGREPEHPGLALPDRRGQENIRWCVGARAARARESGFTLDRALAGRHQAQIQIPSAGAGLLKNLHKTCPVYVFDGRGLEHVAFQDKPRNIEAGDIIITGTSVISVREPAQ